MGDTLYANYDDFDATACVEVFQPTSELKSAVCSLAGTCGLDPNIGRVFLNTATFSFTDVCNGKPDVRLVRPSYLTCKASQGLVRGSRYIIHTVIRVVRLSPTCHGSLGPTSFRTRYLNPLRSLSSIAPNCKAFPNT